MESQEAQNTATIEVPRPTENSSSPKKQDNNTSAMDPQNPTPVNEPLPEKDQKVLGKKIKRSESKKINRELCSICRDGGNLLLCDNCPRSFHIECLKIKEENIPEGKWYCPMCAPKIQKKLEKSQIMSKAPEDKEKERKRLIKNEKRRLWRLKRKEQLEAFKNSQNNNKVLVNKDGNTLIDSFLNAGKNKTHNNYMDYISKMDKLPLENSKICINITYTALSEEDHPNKTLSLPLLFPIPNDILINSNKKLSSLDEALNKNSSLKKILNENKNNENMENNKENNINGDISLKIDDNNMILDINEETKNILKTYNSVNTLNNIIKIKKDLIKYNVILRDYWDIILQKKSSSIYNNKHIIKYPIDDKELYSFPDLYGLEEKYFNKTEGVVYPYFNGKLLTRIINIYYFLLTFSSKL
jgi:hypothetical protein